VPKKRSLVERFWDRVNKFGPLPSVTAIHAYPEIAGTACWEWTGHTCDGYGYIGMQRPDGTYHNRRAHRVAWLLETGKWSTVDTLHKCDNRVCVRFSHLFEGTNQENTADKTAKGRATKGEAVNTAKLTDRKVITIRKALTRGAVGAHLARDYGVSESTIRFIKQGATWKHTMSTNAKLNVNATI